MYVLPCVSITQKLLTNSSVFFIVIYQNYHKSVPVLHRNRLDNMNKKKKKELFNNNFDRCRIVITDKTPCCACNF